MFVEIFFPSPRIFQLHALHERVNHPNYENLVAYYDFVEGEGSATQDQAVDGQMVEFSGVASWAKYRGNELLNGFEETSIISASTNPKSSASLLLSPPCGHEFQ